MFKKPIRSLGVAFLVAFGVSMPTQAQVCAPVENGRVADVQYFDTTIHWSPVVEFRTMTLTITGPCEDIVRTFGPNDDISFDIREIERVTDGQYTWTLRRESTIDPGVQEELQSQRGSGKEDDVWWSYFQAGKIPAGPYTDSGSFSVDRGAVVDPNSGGEKQTVVAKGRSTGLAASVAGGAVGGGGEPGGENTLANKATVLTVSDGVIKNSLCVGFDCPNSPSFGDSTIMMSEHNTRIRFDDTSTASSFPTNGWEIEANSSLNGGANYLGFNDCGTANGGGCATDLVFAVEAGVRQNALYVESDGDIGVGTANPVVRMHLIDGDTPTLRLEQDNSSGFTPQTWDVAGNETNFFVRDATGGSQLPFRIQPGADSNSLFIESTNDVGIGTSAPTEALHVRGTDGSTKLLVEEASGTANGRQVMELRNNGNVNFILVNTAAGGEDWQLLAESTGSFPGFSISRQGSGARELYLDDSGNLEITGEITTSGSCSGGCDLVFDPDYALPSIEEHAAAMFANRHLPSVGPTPEQGPFNLSQKVGGILNELEKAHIYIAQLDEEKRRLEEDLRAEIEELRTALGALAASQD